MKCLKVDSTLSKKNKKASHFSEALLVDYLDEISNNLIVDFDKFLGFFEDKKTAKISLEGTSLPGSNIDLSPNQILDFLEYFSTRI